MLVESQKWAAHSPIPNVPKQECLVKLKALSGRLYRRFALKAFRNWTIGTSALLSRRRGRVGLML
jgi:hypothetical protein